MFGTKLLFVLQDNPSRGLDSHQGQVILADGETGQLRALLDASAVTAIRTAAVLRAATVCLRDEDASVLAIIGTGVQARKHLESIPLVRALHTVLRGGAARPIMRARLSTRRAQRTWPIVMAESVEDAVRDGRHRRDRHRFADAGHRTANGCARARMSMRSAPAADAVGNRSAHLGGRGCLCRSARVALC